MFTHNRNKIAYESKQTNKKLLVNSKDKTEYGGMKYNGQSQRAINATVNTWSI